MLGGLLARHDLIVVDNRGTGSSGAIDCPRLQAYKGNYVREVGRCGRKLGKRADAYGSGAAADDLAAVLDRLQVPVINIYGDSYGTYFAQTFAVRHPDARASRRARCRVCRDRLRSVGARAERADPLRLARRLRALGRLRGRSARRAGCARAAPRAPAAGGQGARRRRHPSPGPPRRHRDRPDERRRKQLLRDLPRPARGRTRP